LILIFQIVTNNVLDWSKLERDAETSSRPVALDIRTVCESILVLLPNKDDEAEVELIVVVKPDVPRSMFLDETYIHRILMNLLSNALKFTRSGYILLLVEFENENLVATVKDTGSGVPPSFLPQLFEPFKQAQTRGSQRGTGLGLSIVKQLLHKMGGNITVESRHPEAGEIEPAPSGSTFTISIPVQTSATNDDAIFPALLPKIAIFHAGNERSVEGLQTAWFVCSSHFFLFQNVSGQTRRTPRLYKSFKQYERLVYVPTFHPLFS
jgi:signal transduction histidine kinase